MKNLVNNSLDSFLNEISVTPEGNLDPNYFEYNTDDIMDTIANTADTSLSPDEVAEIIDFLIEIGNKDLAIKGLQALTSFHPYIQTNDFTEPIERLLYHYFPEKFN